MFAVSLVVGVVLVVPLARCAQWPCGNGGLIGGDKGKCVFGGICQGMKLTLSEGVKKGVFKMWEMVYPPFKKEDTPNI